MSPQKIPVASEMSQDDWRMLEAAVEHLESAWQTGENPRLAQFVPDCSAGLRIRILAEMVKVDQEHRWEERDHRFLEEYLAQWPELVGFPNVLAELVQAECLTRAVVDRLPTLGELAHRFPEIAGTVDLEQIAQRMLREDLPVRTDPTGLQLRATVHNGSADTPVPRSRCRELRVGGRLGRYEIRSVLGRGGMGTVYRAYDTQLERDVALKVPRFDPETESELLERFIDEARLAAGIRHPNVCPVFDAGQIEEVSYLTMAFIDGGSLEDRVRQGLMAQRDAVEIVCKVAAAVETVHNAGMIHRDIKPSNVLIDRFGEPFLTDFGLARLNSGSDGGTTAGLFSGTPDYMAPEQLAGGLVDERSDVYSLAVLLHRLITRRLPRSLTPTNRDGRASGADLDKPVAFGLGMDSELAAIFRRALSNDPTARHASARELANDLKTYLSHDDEARSRRPAVRLPVAVVALAAGLICWFGILYAIQSNRVGKQITPSRAALNPKNLLGSMLTVKWSQLMTHGTPTAVSRVQMMPKGNHLLALFNTTSSVGSVARISAQSGESLWQKQLLLEGRVFENGWINRQGEVFLTSCVGGYTIWKVDSEIDHELARYRAGRGCEYISAIITDQSDNVYISGYEGSQPGAGSTCAKLTPDLRLSWNNNTQMTQGKDDYALDMDLDSNGNLFRVGYDNPVADQTQARGRVLSHRNSDGKLRFNYQVDEMNSFVGGVLVDGDSYWYHAYSYNAYDETGTPTGVERTVVEKRDLEGNLIWRDEIPYTGIVITRNALSWNHYGSFLLTFQINVAGKSYPGMALYSCEGGRFWLKLVDRPGWNFARAGAEVVGRTAYLGLNNNSNRLETDVVAVPLDRQ